MKLSALPSYNGATVGMTVTGAGIGTNTIVSAVSGNATSGYTLTLLYQPGGYGTADLGATADIPAGSTLTFGVPAENTNFLSTVGTGPFTYNYEFGQSNTIEGQNIGITIAGAAVPGTPETAPTSDQIQQYYQTASLPAGLTGYVNGGWTGVGSGSPNAFGYIDPTDTGSVYIAPNITFDFSEVQYQNKSAATALADWESLFNQMSANSATPVIVWPWHDYGATNWGSPPPGYTTAMYMSFIQYAYNAGYEFVTSEDLASRIAAEQAATLKESTSGNVITATVTPGASKPDLGAMALNVVNGAAGQVIQNAGNWYAYDSNSVFLFNDAANKAAPENFTVTLGATQDDVTHVDALPMRADLKSVTGDGSNLAFSMTGDGTVDIHVKTPGSNIISVNTSAVGTVGTGGAAPAAMLAGADLKLVFNDGALAVSSTSPEGVPVLHNVTINEGATAVVSSGAILFDVSVAYSLANKSALDVAAAIGILDLSANVLANLKGLSTDGLNDTHIASITLTDSTPPALKVTIAQAQLQRQLALGSYKTAWLMCAKLRRSMLTPDRSPLAGLVEVDETEIACRSKHDPLTGGGGRSHQGKMLIVGAVEVQDGGAGPGRIRLAEVADYSTSSLHPFVAQNLATGAIAKTDGWSAYPGAPGVSHDPHVIGKMAAHVVLPWVHRVFSNLKVWALGVYHGLRRRYLQSYLDEFVFRFNRRRTRHAAFRSLLGIAAGHAPVTYQMLISPEASA